MPVRRRPKVSSWQGVTYRATSYDVPLWSAPNRRDGRWNLAGSGSTQYMCLDGEAPFAEKLRQENLRTEEEAAFYVTSIWQIKVDEGAVVDYSSFERAEAAGFPADALVDDDHEPCQAEAERLRSLGVRGLLSPCAALPGSTNLTLFGPRVQVAWETEVRLASTLPVQRLVTGHPPKGLVDRVRYFGDEYAGLGEFIAARKRAE